MVSVSPDALPEVTMVEASERFALVNADLAAAQQGSVIVGLAELQSTMLLRISLRGPTRPCTRRHKVRVGFTARTVARAV
ncbi:MAG: hypothetical protein ACYC91_19490 [Solirubrobacteraceae bacterium]